MATENTFHLPGRDEITAYVTQDGLIALKQESPNGEDPSVVLMLPSDVPTVVIWLQQLAEQIAAEG